MMRYIILVLTIAVFFFSCEKEKDRDDSLGDVSPIPQIEYLGVDVTQINQFGEVNISISYLDGDGDLGHPNADSNTLIVTDLRNNIEIPYHIAPLAPSGSNIIIRGELQINVQGIILLDQSNTSEDVQFSIRLRDLAGNWSNSVTSASIKVVK